MKKIIVGVAMLMAAGSVFAANSHQAGKLALGVDTSESDIITGKYMLSSDMALTGGLLFGMNGGDADGTDFGFRIGARSYMSNDDFSPFLGGRLGYATTNDGDDKVLEVAFEFGAEYFFAKQFSVEGSAAVGYTSEDTAGPDTTRLGTSRAAVGFNFYF